MSEPYVLGTEAHYDTWYTVDEHTADQVGRMFGMNQYARDIYVGFASGSYAVLMVVEGELQFHIWHPDTPAGEVDEWVRDLADPKYSGQVMTGVTVRTS